MSDGPLPSPARVATDLRWRVVREVLLDPFGWVGLALAGLVASRVGRGFSPEAVALAAPLLTLAVAWGAADRLLFRAPENDLLRTQPLGPRGLLEVRGSELGWWTHVPSLLGAAFGWGAGGPGLAAAAWVGGRLTVRGGVTLAILGRRAAGNQGAAVGPLVLAGLMLALLVAPLPALPVPAWAWAAPVAGAGFLLGRAVPGLWDRHFERLASDAAAAPDRPRRPLWSLLSTLLPLPARLRSGVVADLVLLIRGQDPRGALLLLASPAAVLALELSSNPSAAQLGWRALSAAALGGSAVAYAVGPAVHRSRMAVLPWLRTAPRPGERLLGVALLWGLGWATLHGALVLGWIAAYRGGWYLPELRSLVVPVLGLEWAMAHFGVVFTLSRASGREVIGESMLAFALPVVAVGVALAGTLMPATMLLYPVLTAGMTGDARRRLAAMEVTG